MAGDMSKVSACEIDFRVSREMNDELQTHITRLSLLIIRLTDNRIEWSKSVAYNATGLPTEIFKIDMKQLSILEELTECLTDLLLDIGKLTYGYRS